MPAARHAAVVTRFKVGARLPHSLTRTQSKTSPMTLQITDPAILFPGISLLFLAYTNRYLALASIIRELNKVIANSTEYDDNREQQIKNLLSRITLIRLMQLQGILAFLSCTISMSALLLGFKLIGQIAFGGSLLFMFMSLCFAYLEVSRSGDGLRLEIDRTHPDRESPVT